jgi:electron transport complex protein RnfG
MLVAVSADGTCRSVAVLEQNETPGLGTNVLSEKFQAQFEGKTLKEMKLVKDGGKLDAITGATISSKAAIKAVRLGMEAGSK